MTERWLPVVGYEEWYDVSDHGRVRRMARGNRTHVGKILSPGNVRGYEQVTMHMNNRRIQKKVHRLVAAAFIGQCPDGEEVNHIDGVKSNNYVGNLEYVTSSENATHAYVLGLNHRGEAHGRSKLTEESVHMIRRLIGKESHRSIARRYHVCKGTIGDISTGRSWAWLKESK